MTFSFVQISGPNVFVNAVAVPLGQPIPSTFTGTAAANNQTGTAQFTAPIFTAKQPNIVLQVTETDIRAGLSTTQSITITDQPIVADAVSITSVTYRQIVSRVGAPAEFGKFNMTASSSALVAPPAGWTMTATLTARLANGTLSTPVTLPLLLTPADVPGTPAGLGVCGATPCWVGATNGIIIDASVTPAVLVAPDTIVLKSSLGGTTTVLKGNPIYVLR